MVLSSSSDCGGGGERSDCGNVLLGLPLANRSSGETGDGRLVEDDGDGDSGKRFGSLEKTR